MRITLAGSRKRQCAASAASVSHAAGLPYVDHRGFVMVDRRKKEKKKYTQGNYNGRDPGISGSAPLRSSEERQVARTPRRVFAGARANFERFSIDRQ